MRGDGGNGQDETRAKLLVAAHEQFAERGFYGASIAQIAGELGLTKQALLYHFKRKEDLYAEVLQAISSRLTANLALPSQSAQSPEARLREIFLGLYRSALENPSDTRILTRELLDNRTRAEKAKDWYLRPFLDEITTALSRISGFEDRSEPELFAIIYQMLGGIEYMAISEPTLRQMYGDERYEEIVAQYPQAISEQIDRLIASTKASS